MGIPQNDAYLAQMQSIPVIALYRRGKAGETIKVRTREQPLVKVEPEVFEIRPKQSTEGSPVNAATILYHDRVMEDSTNMPITDVNFLDWMERLEAAKA